MTIHKTKLQRQGREKRDARKFFLVLGGITLLLIILIYFISR